MPYMLSRSMAQIIKRGKSYTVIVQAYRTPDGKRVTKSATIRPESTTPKAIEDEVKEFAKAFEKKVKEGRILDGDSITFYDFAQSTWKEWLCVQKDKPLRFENYERVLILRAYPFIGGMKLSSINSMHIQNLIDDMRKKGLAVATMKSAVASMSSVFSCAVKKHVIESNPCDGSRLDFPSTPKKEMQFFDEDQAKTFLSLLENEPIELKAYFYLAIFGGFRRGEIIPLLWSDINWKEHTISITKSAVQVKGEIVIKPSPKTRSSIRDVVLPDKAMSVLKQLRRSQQVISKDGNLFMSPKGKLMYLNAPYANLKRIIREYNSTHDDKLPNIRLHDLRHTTATILINAGVDIETVALILGHATVSMTVNKYGHSTKKSQQRAAETLQKLLVNE